MAVANMLGTGITETPALAAFLPGLSRHLLGEELAMPSVATWWCGQEDPCRYVLDHPEGLVIKPALQAKRESPAGGPKKKISCLVGRITLPRISGNSLPIHGPQAKT